MKVTCSIDDVDAVSFLRSLCALKRIKLDIPAKKVMLKTSKKYAKSIFGSP
jgi:hypothetical protein